jgi:hypothetical protein
MCEEKFNRAKAIISEITIFENELKFFENVPIKSIQFHSQSRFRNVSTNFAKEGERGLRGFEQFADDMIKAYKSVLRKKIAELKKEFENF